VLRELKRGALSREAPYFGQFIDYERGESPYADGRGSDLATLDLGLVVPARRADALVTCQKGEECRM